MMVARRRVSLLPGHRTQDFRVKNSHFSLSQAMANEIHNIQQFIYFPTVLGLMLSCLKKSICVLLQ